jgi:Ca2+-binding EF-hand superfamily protein
LYDLDKDGVISKDEMLLVLEALYKLLAHSATTFPEGEKSAECRLEILFLLMDTVRQL